MKTKIEMFEIGDRVVAGGSSYWNRSGVIPGDKGTIDSVDTVRGDTGAIYIHVVFDHGREQWCEPFRVNRANEKEAGK